MNSSAKAWSLSMCALWTAILGFSDRAFAANVFVNDITGTGARSYFDTTIWPNSTLPLSTDQPIVDKGDGINDYVYIDQNLQVARFNIGNQDTGGLEIRSGAYAYLNQGSNQVNIGPSGSAAGSLPGVGYLRIKSGATLEQSGL